MHIKDKDKLLPQKLGVTHGKAMENLVVLGHYKAEEGKDDLCMVSDVR